MKKTNFLFIVIAVVALVALVMMGCPQGVEEDSPSASALAEALADDADLHENVDINHATLTLKKDVSISSDRTLTIPARVKLNTGAHKLTVSGTLDVGSGTLIVPATGTVTVEGTGALNVGSGTLVVDGAVQCTGTLRTSYDSTLMISSNLGYLPSLYGTAGADYTSGLSVKGTAIDTAAKTLTVYLAGTVAQGIPTALESTYGSLTTGVAVAQLKDFFNLGRAVTVSSAAFVREENPALALYTAANSTTMEVTTTTAEDDDRLLAATTADRTYWNNTATSKYYAGKKYTSNISIDDNHFPVLLKPDETLVKFELFESDATTVQQTVVINYSGVTINNPSPD
jgi:hypothetical protein